MSEAIYERSGFIAGMHGSPTLVDNSRVIFFIGLTMDILFFAGLAGCYLVLRSGVPQWPPPDLPYLNKELIGASAVSLGLAAMFLSLTVLAQRHNELKPMRGALIAALFFLVAFLGMNGLEWKTLLAEGLPIRTVFGGIYFVVTGIFHLHIIGCTLYILSRYKHTLRWRRYTRSAQSIAHLSYFIYGMLAVWVGIFGVIYW